VSLGGGVVAQHGDGPAVAAGPQREGEPGLRRRLRTEIGLSRPARGCVAQSLMHPSAVGGDGQFGQVAVAQALLAQRRRGRAAKRQQLSEAGVSECQPKQETKMVVQTCMQI